MNEVQSACASSVKQPSVNNCTRPISPSCFKSRLFRIEPWQNCQAQRAWLVNVCGFYSFDPYAPNGLSPQTTTRTCTVVSECEYGIDSQLFIDTVTSAGVIISARTGWTRRPIQENTGVTRLWPPSPRHRERWSDHYIRSRHLPPAKVINRPPCPRSI